MYRRVLLILDCILFIDIDECSRTSGICSNGVCENMMGTYQCVCDDGYRQTDQKFYCEGNQRINFKLIKIVLFSKSPLNVNIVIICFNLLINGFIIGTYYQMQYKLSKSLRAIIIIF